MTVHDHHAHPEAGSNTDRTVLAPTAHRHGGHGLMMIVCCIPMLLIAGVLVLTGVLSPGFLLLAVACTAMMAMMMTGMHDDRR
jgi:hypothetical protein